MGANMQSLARLGTTVLLAALGAPAALLFVVNAPPGAAVASSAPTSFEDVQEAIQSSLCLGDWNRAIALTGTLMAQPQFSPAYRSTLVSFRRQLESLRDTRQSVSDRAGCDAALAQFVAAELVPETAQPLNWEKAIATLTDRSYTGVPDQLARQIEGFAVAGLARLVDTDVAALTPARPIDTRAGSGVSAGQVGQGYEVFTFVGGLGDRVNIDLDVTRVLPGILYSDDDSQLFLFDGQGQLLAENDDFRRLQSRITNFVLPRSGSYYVVVTTYNNDPVLDGDNRVVGWSGSGGSAIEFTLSVTGVTPTDQLVFPEEASR